MPPPTDAAGPQIRPADLGIGRLFEAIRDAVIVADASGRIVLWNAGAEAIFGYASEEVVGRDVSMLVPERLVRRHEAGMARFAATGRGPLLESDLPVEMPARRKDGQELVVELSLASIEQEGRRYALAIARDVTERARLLEELERRTRDLQRTNEALRQANDSLTSFTYVVSHDLKEPVRAMDTYLRVLQEDYGAQLPPDARDLVARALLATGRLSALLRGLLDLSRIERPQQHAKDVSVEEVLESDPCRAVYEGLLQERQGKLETIRDAPRVRAPPSILCQVLGNLVTNALRHNPSPRPRVRVDGEPSPDGLVELRVEDDGPGFPPGFVEEFNRASERSRPTALRGGFGLLIAKRGVERLGGRMWLGRSDELGGAAVRFTVPAAE